MGVGTELNNRWLMDMEILDYIMDEWTTKETLLEGIEMVQRLQTKPQCLLVKEKEVKN